MGYNTVVLVHNDSLGAIAEDKYFGIRLQDAVLNYSTATTEMNNVPAIGEHAFHCNAAKVVSVFHADSIKLFALGANTGWDLGASVGYSAARKSPEEFHTLLLKALADKLGYTLRKKPQPKGTK
jgi:hypothetical protein